MGLCGPVWHHVAPHHAVIAFSVKGALGDASLWEPVRAFPFGKSTFRHADGLTVHVVVSYHGGPTQILSNSTCVSKRLRRLDKKKRFNVLPSPSTVRSASYTVGSKLATVKKKQQQPLFNNVSMPFYLAWVEEVVLAEIESLIETILMVHWTAVGGFLHNLSRQFVGF